MQSIAIVGGTFDPIHWGHLQIAEAALSQVALDRVLWVPVDRSAHKPAPKASFADRLEMVRLGITSQPAFEVSTVEAQRSGVSYAIDTLTDLQRIYPNVQWHWIIGADAFQSVPRWRSAAQLAAQCTWLVAPRRAPPEREPESDLGLAQVAQLKVRQIQMPIVNLSSSQVRALCRQGRSLQDAVPAAVWEYITLHKLYIV